VLAVQIAWTKSVETALEGGGSKKLDAPLAFAEKVLQVLADAILNDMGALTRQKCEHLITTLVHERDVIRRLVRDQVKNERDFAWLSQMRFYHLATVVDVTKRVAVRMANAEFEYGFEYLGVPDRIVQTPLTDRCYLTLTQALHARLGGSPFGPAGLYFNRSTPNVRYGQDGIGEGVGCSTRSLCACLLLR
jgi:dynein heavy chain 1